MKSFFVALQYLTIIPLSIKKVDNDDLTQSQAFFPLVGFFLGIILACVYFLLSFLFPSEVVDIIIIILLVFITGGLHLDGLSDTLDALGSGKNRDGMLQVMKDSNIGAMGATGIFCILLLKIGFFCSIPDEIKIRTLILLPALSRFSILLPCMIFPYARSLNGKARPFIEVAGMKRFIISPIFTFFLALALLYLKGIILFLLITIFALILCKYLNSKFKGLTGDTLGFTVEITEVFYLCSLLVLEGVKI